MDNFIGKDGFFWWMGVVEDNEDPLGLGRMRIRIFGYHTDNLNEIPVDTLPWAIPCWSTNNSMTSAAGLPGDYAFGFFGDGASSEGDIHESMNLAGLVKAPVIFFLQNNGWAISTPRSAQTAARTHPFLWNRLPRLLHG